MTIDRARRRWLMPLAVAPAALALVVTAPANPVAGTTARPAAARVVTVAAAPAPQAVAVAPVQHAPATGSHVVQVGETLSQIALRYGVGTGALAAANGLADPDYVRSGTELVIPSGSDPAAAATGGGSGGSGSGSTAGLPDRLQASPARLAYIPRFDHWASANGIPADLLKAMTWLESGWQQGLTSSTGAVGIGQLMPDTVDFMEELIGVDLDQYAAEDNIRMSARYLRWLLQRYDTTSEALAAYYQGPSSIERNGTYAETDRYVANVLALRARF